MHKRQFLMGLGALLFAPIGGISMVNAAPQSSNPKRKTLATLSARHEHFVLVAAFTALGNTTQLRQALAAALDAKLSISELRDALVQLYAYCGFPRSLTALSELLSLLNERKAAGIVDIEGQKANPRPAPEKLHEVGTATQTRLVGAPVKGALFDFAPDIDAYLKEHLFGDIFSTGILDDATREIVTVAALAALPAPAQLASHLQIAQNVGVRPKALTGLAATLKLHVGKNEGELVESLLSH